MGTDRDSILRFSVSLGIAAGMTVGQMQHRGMLPAREDEPPQAHMDLGADRSGTDLTLVVDEARRAFLPVTECILHDSHTDTKILVEVIEPGLQLLI